MVLWLEQEKYSGGAICDIMPLDPRANIVACSPPAFPTGDHPRAVLLSCNKTSAGTTPLTFALMVMEVIKRAHDSAAENSYNQCLKLIVHYRLCAAVEFSSLSDC
jgi:hypothetical protein